MQNGNLVPADVCCTHYNIEMSFIQSLNQYGFIHIVSVEENQFIDMNELYELEKFIRLHYELDINMEGIDAINHLLERVQYMQDQIAFLKNKLSVYEDLTQTSLQSRGA